MTTEAAEQDIGKTIDCAIDPDYWKKEQQEWLMNLDPKLMKLRKGLAWLYLMFRSEKEWTESDREKLRILIEHHPKVARFRFPLAYRNPLGRAYPLFATITNAKKLGNEQEQFELIRILYEANPDVLSEHDGNYGLMPLHMACRQQLGADVIQLFVSKHPEAATVLSRTEHGGFSGREWLPIHFYLSCSTDLDEGIVEALATAAPETCYKDYIVVTSAFAFAARTGKPPSILKHLLPQDPKCTHLDLKTGLMRMVGTRIGPNAGAWLGANMPSHISKLSVNTDYFTRIGFVSLFTGLGNNSNLSELDVLFPSVPATPLVPAPGGAAPLPRDVAHAIMEGVRRQLAGTAGAPVARDTFGVEGDVDSSRTEPDATHDAIVAFIRQNLQLSNIAVCCNRPATEIIRAVADNPAIVKARFNVNRSSDLDELSRLNNLQELTVTSREKANVTSIGSLLETSSKLKSLDVAGFSMPITELCEPLKTNKTLESLTLRVSSEREVKSVSMELAPVLEAHNCTLTHVLVRATNVVRSISDKLSFYGRLNACGRAQLRRSESTKADLVELLEAVPHSESALTKPGPACLYPRVLLEEDSVRYALLREAPYLWSQVGACDDAMVVDNPTPSKRPRL